MADLQDQSTAPLDEKLLRYLRDIADPKSYAHFHYDGFPRPSLASDARAFLAHIDAGRLTIAVVASEPPAPLCPHCKRRPCEPGCGTCYDCRHRSAVGYRKVQLTLSPPSHGKSAGGLMREEGETARLIAASKKPEEAK